ncbi:hypothetical protein NL676_000026 [Syzygium grande]|nr:hypothetical protein NL676_000026 [Syzygium grande]
MPSPLRNIEEKQIRKVILLNLMMRVYVATHQLSAQEKEYGDTIVKKALDNNIDVMEFNGGLEAPLANVGLTAEGQSQNTNFGNAMEFPVHESVFQAADQPISADQNANFGNAMDISIDEGVPVASHQPISADQNANFGNAMMFSVDQPIPADNSNVLFYPGDNGITNVGLPNQSHDINLPYAMGSPFIDPLSPMASTIHELTLPYEPYTPIADLQYSSTRPLAEGNHVMQSFHSTMADDNMDFLLAGDNDTCFQAPLWDDGFV